NPGTANIPVVYMSGYGAELQASRAETSNVIGFLNKPFTSDLLIKTVETHMPRKPEKPKSVEPQAPSAEEPRPMEAELPMEQEPAYRETSEVGAEVSQSAEAPWWSPAGSETANAEFVQPVAEQYYVPDDSVTGGAHFCGDTRFLSLHRALRIIATQKLT